MQRRKFLSTSTVASVGRLVSSTLHAKEQKITATTTLKHNINHSACYWCYNSIPLEAFLKNLNEQDFKAIDLVGPEDWPLLKRYNIHPCVGPLRLALPKDGVTRSTTGY